MQIVNLERIARMLIEDAMTIPAREAERRVDSGSGLYAIFVDRASSLPAAFRCRLVQKATKLIYIGVARDSLQRSLVSQDLRGGGRSLFVRNLGAVLGFRPVEGSMKGTKYPYSYKFSEADRQEIVAWINRHLSVRTLAVKRAHLGQTGESLIRTRVPVLNVENNPVVMPELEAVREDCRRLAMGETRSPELGIA